MLNDLSLAAASRIFNRRSFFIIAGVTTIALAVGINRSSAAPVEEHELLHDIVQTDSISAKVGTRQILMEVTAYCACPKCCGPNAKGFTASGRKVSYNDGKFVAADTSVLPFGTKLLIPGYSNQPVEVIDRGSAIKGNKLDVFFASHEEARRWGRRIISVSVVE